MMSSLSSNHVLLLKGIALRFAVTCGVCVAFRMARSYISGSEGAKIKARLRSRVLLKVWATSFVLDTGASLLALPGAYIVGKHVTRLIIDAFAPASSRALCRLDGFSYGAFLAVAGDVNSGPGSGSATQVVNAFTWQLPSLAVTLAKLLLRARRHGMKRTRFFRCLAVALVQYAARVPLMSFATMLPMSDSELVMCAACVATDSLSDSYLAYHTWPLDAPSAASHSP